MKFIINACHWDDEDHVVTIREAEDSPVSDHVLGQTLTAKDAKIVEGWLRYALRDLLVIGANIGKEEALKSTT